MTEPDIGKSPERQLAAEIVEEFCQVLTDKGMRIPNPERKGNKNAAAIYGEDYYNLEDAITEKLEEESRELYLATFDIHNGEAGYVLKHAIRARTLKAAEAKARRFVKEFYMEDARPVKESWRAKGAYERKDGSEYIEFKGVGKVNVRQLILEVSI